MRRLLTGAAVLALAACVDGTPGDLSGFGDRATTITDTANRDYYPDDQHIVSAKLQFKQENYGKAASLFKQALEVAPTDPEALLGYAAANDMLARFDQSDLAYRQLKPIIGNTVVFHNNYGYSLLLRGNLQGARQHFLAAYEMAPDNPHVANNLELLRNSVNYQRRAKGDLQGI
ncbi:tetratricopeptide repeat protein [Tabrizicola oligotrophica]|uniref:Tetratricopeptide repeat protein n=1 Tax=Tabrizicola oligotrophica TaxID=2710650 RepID=A0A6M0QXU5_9RHOB|nr:tetratricopeptide repeat protein [Tabrizicola oligotrophica]NEY91262.1 tetratricopeptide repeat protein [Tabrizicola oligotrophica]